MQSNDYCINHSEHESRIRRSEDDIQGLWKEVDKMKTWFIFGMGSLIVQGIAIVTAIILKVV